MTTTADTPTPKKTTARKTTKKTAASKPAAVGDVQLLTIAHDAIDPNPANVRLSIPEDDSLRELAASIAERGLIEPLIVHPAETTGRYTLLAGHRRHAAAALLVPAPALQCIVRPAPGSLVEAVADMVVENQHRQNLSPIEEARAYFAMALDLDDDAIATKVGLPRRRIRERRDLLQLAEPAQQRLHDGQMTLEQAASLVDFAGDADAVEELEQAIEEDRPGYYGWRETYARLKVRRDDALAVSAVETELEAAGRVVHHSKADLRWSNSLDAPSLPSTPEEHDATGCTGLVASVRPGTPPKVDWFCLTPAKHQPAAAPEADDAGDDQPRGGFGGEPDDRDDEDYARVRAEREAEEEARRERESKAREDCVVATRLRRDHLRALIGGQYDLPDAAAWQVAAWYARVNAVYEEGSDRDTLLELLNVPLSEDPDSGRDRWDIENERIEQALAKAGPARACLAVAAAVREPDLAQAWRWNRTSLGRDQLNLEWLQLVGGPLAHEWTSWEGERLDAARALAAEIAAEEAAAAAKDEGDE